QGLSKRVNLPHFKNIRRGGLIAIRLNEDDELIAVCNTDGDKDIGIATKHGYFIRSDENVVRTSGRNAAGVKGISLRENDEVVAMQKIKPISTWWKKRKKEIGSETKENDFRKTSVDGNGYLVDN